MQARARAWDGILERTLRDASTKVGRDARLIAVATLFGLGLGGLLHRLFVVLLIRWDRLDIARNAPSAWLRDRLLVGSIVAVAAGVTAFALTGAGHSRTWSWRRAAGISIAVAGIVVLVVGELEVHVFRTLEQGWTPHDLVWDVVFHVPGEAVALLGWLLLPVLRRPVEPVAPRPGP